MKYISKQIKHELWMAQFENAILNIYPSLSGRIDWTTVQHYFHTGLTPEQGTNKYLLNPDNLPENKVRLI